MGSKGIATRPVVSKKRAVRGSTRVTAPSSWTREQAEPKFRFGDHVPMCVRLKEGFGRSNVGDVLWE
jgi:hypothetical protein